MVAGFENSPTSPGVISGGANSAAQGQFGYGISPIVMIPPDPPSGSSGNPTRILGANYASCGTNLVGGDPAKVEYLASINTAPYSLRLQNATWVDVECLNLNGEGAASAFGIFTGNATSGNITLKNLTIGGYNSSGIQGTVGGAWTVTDVEIQYNAKAGWNFDDGFGDPSTGSVTASYLGIDWNGCAQEWPLVHTIPIANGGCLDDSSGGYGDGIGTPETPLTFSCDHCRGTNNTQDGYDFVHAVGGTISITNSNFSGNMGGNIKIGPEASVTVYNNTVMVNCLRLKYAYPGVQTGYNTNLSDFCRAAGDGNAANMLTSAEYVGNAYAVGTAVTGTDTHFTTQLSIGNVIAPADFPFSTYGGITVTHITDDTHLTVSGSYPTNWGSSGSPLHLIYIPGGTPSSSSVDTWHNNDLIGYGATMIVGTCLTGTLVGGGSASASTDLSYCTGYTYIFKNNGVLGYVDQNCDFGSCGDGTTPPELFFGVLPTVQDYNIFTNLVACPSVGAHDSCAKLMDFVSQPASPVPSGQESNLDNFNYNITSGSDAIHGGTTPCPSTDQAGATQTSPCTIGAVVLAGTPTAATPTFSPVAGTYTGTQNVTISTSTGGATLCYTIDGTTPTANGAGTCTHGTTYSTAVSVASSLTLKAIASESGFLDSAVGSAAYTINPPPTPNVTLINVKISGQTKIGQ